MLDADLMKEVQAVLEKSYGPGKWAVTSADGAIYLNDALMESKNVNAGEAQEIAGSALERIPHVFRVYTHHQLRRGHVPQDDLSRIMSRSFNWSRSADLEVILDPHWTRPATNSGHDTPFSYDTHIPMIFLGSGIKPGLYYQNVELNDLAPTLSTLLSVQTPSGSVGRVLHEILPQPNRQGAAASASSHQ